MKFSIDKSKLSDLFALADIAKRSNGIIASITHIAIDAKDNGTVYLSATDLSISLIVKIHDVDVTETGGACIPAGKFLEFVKLSTDDSILIETMSNGHVKLKTKSSTFKVPATARDQFPELPKYQKHDPTIIPCNALLRMISRTSFAVSRQEHQYALKNLHMFTGDGHCEISAADGKRIAVAGYDLDEAAGLDILIPEQSTNIINALCSPKMDGTVDVWANDNQIFFMIGAKMLIINRPIGVFPDISAIHLKQPYHSIKFNVERLSLSIQRSALAVKENCNYVVLDLSTGKIVAEDFGTGQIDESLPTEERADVAVALNFKMLLEILARSRSDNVVIDFQAHDVPVQIRIEGEEKSSYRCLLMPVGNAVTEKPKAAETEEPISEEDDFLL